MTIGLIDDVGLVVPIIPPDAYDSDNKAATDLQTLNIEGYDGATLILGWGTCGSGASAQVNVVFSSTGSASDAAEITLATDAVFTAIDSDTTAPGVEVMELDFTLAGLGGVGVLGATITMTKDVDLAMYAIPWIGCKSKPVSQTNTVLRKG